MTEALEKFIIKNGSSPSVRFTGKIIGKLTETVSLHGDTHERRWTLYRTAGGQYLLQRRVATYQDVASFKTPKQVLTHLRKYPTSESQGGPREWSPHHDYGIPEPQAKFLMDAGPEFVALFFTDVE